MFVGLFTSPVDYMPHFYLSFSIFFLVILVWFYYLIVLSGIYYIYIYIYLSCTLGDVSLSGPISILFEVTILYK